EADQPSSTPARFVETVAGAGRSHVADGGDGRICLRREIRGGRGFPQGAADYVEAGAATGTARVVHDVLPGHRRAAVGPPRRCTADISIAPRCRTRWIPCRGSRA